jgi:hypothetical protein
MNARNKLNVAYLNGAVLLAIVAGVFTQSWLVFIVFLVVGVCVGLHFGSIRPNRRHRQHGPR